MAEKYFSIPLGNHPALMEVQQYLQSVLPDGTQWQDPATFHITLVYIVDDMGKELTITPPTLPAFGIGAWGIDFFATPDGYAVHLAIDRHPVLMALQTVLFYEAFIGGMIVSDKSWPSLYKPHITMAYTSEFPQLDSMSLPTPIHLQIEGFSQTAEGYNEVGNYALMMTMPGQESPIMEMTRFANEWVFTEFKGERPNIENFTGIDIASLTAGDDDPVYVELPVAEVDSTSANGVYYNEEFVRVLERQMFAKRPTGNQGHIKDEERDSVFPTPAGYWIGAKRVGKVLYGKAYLPPNHPMREIVRRLKAVGAKISTSIYGTGERVWDKTRGAWVALPDKFNLEHIDFAPSDRAGVGSLARVPQIVSEMSQEDVKMPEKADIIKELTIGDIPESLKSAIVADVPEVGLVAEMRQKLGLDEKADLGSLMAEMQSKIAKIEADAIEQTIISEVAANVMPDVKVVTDGVKAVRSTIAELVRAKSPKLETIKDVVAEIAGSDMAKGLYANALTAAMGPALGQHVKRENDGNGASGMLSPQSEELLKKAKV